MSLTIKPTNQACGAWISGIALHRELDEDIVGKIRAAWLKYGVMVFPDQVVSDAGCVFNIQKTPALIFCVL